MLNAERRMKDNFFHSSFRPSSSRVFSVSCFLYSSCHLSLVTIFMRIAIIGAGSWGTALAVVAARGEHDVCLWARSAEVVEEIHRQRMNGGYLANCQIPSRVRATNDFGEALKDAEIVILAMPSHVARAVLMSLKFYAAPQMIFVSAAKGIEIATGERISQIIRDVFGDWTIAPRVVALSGPSFAREVVEGHPTAIVAASDSLADARAVQESLSVGNLRVYANDDLIGVELGGALKNVMAIAAGMCVGLELGANSIAALITRGLAEMTRCGVAKGARRETLAGLAGLGDLVLTCTGRLSRNRFVGEEIGRGRKLEDVLSGMRETAEGVKTARAIYTEAKRMSIEMPIAAEVYKVLYDAKPPRAAIEDLMSRPLKDE
jgi:glycerol-3-phosphate dehydrogenase (NAD(P)+)